MSQEQWPFYAMSFVILKMSIKTALNILLPRLVNIHGTRTRQYIKVILVSDL